MNATLKHIAIALCAIVLFPAILSFTHALEKHEHKSCDNPTSVHFHEKQIDCSLYKFQHSPVITITPIDFQINTTIVYKTAPFNSTNILTKRTLTLWHLRGPPVRIFS